MGMGLKFAKSSPCKVAHGLITNADRAPIPLADVKLGTGVCVHRRAAFDRGGWPRRPWEVIYKEWHTSDRPKSMDVMWNLLDDYEP